MFSTVYLYHVHIHLHSSTSYDVIFTAGKSNILEKFDSLDARVVFGAEDFCWPDKTLAGHYPRVSFGYKYLNSGGKLKA